MGGSIRDSSSDFDVVTLTPGEWFTKVGVSWGVGGDDLITLLALRTNLGRSFSWGHDPTSGGDLEVERGDDCKLSYFSGEQGGYLDSLNVIWDC